MKTDDIREYLGYKPWSTFALDVIAQRLKQRGSECDSYLLATLYDGTGRTTKMLVNAAYDLALGYRTILQAYNSLYTIELGHQLTDICNKIGMPIVRTHLGARRVAAERPDLEPSAVTVTYSDHRGRTTSVLERVVIGGQ